MENQDRAKTGLCFTRKINESVTVETPQGKLEVVLVGVMGGKARLLFSGGKDILIYRTEAPKHPKLD